MEERIFFINDESKMIPLQVKSPKATSNFTGRYGAYTLTLIIEISQHTYPLRDKRICKKSETWRHKHIVLTGERQAEMQKIKTLSQPFICGDKEKSAVPFIVPDEVSKYIQGVKYIPCKRIGKNQIDKDKSVQYKVLWLKDIGYPSRLPILKTPAPYIYYLKIAHSQSRLIEVG
ncbi:hypothetical protein HI914_03685 [Erysiphe necator]|nr:hypothetical protein HI914_03685 [Erysiphe necator]